MDEILEKVVKFTLSALKTQFSRIVSSINNVPNWVFLEFTYLVEEG